MFRYKLKNYLQLTKNVFTSDESYTAKRFKKKFGYDFNFSHPKTFNEIINTLKLSDECYKLANYVDKFEVRSFVEKTIGKEYLVPIIGVYKNFDRKIFDSLPESFIIKGTHGSAMNYLVKNKTDEDFLHLRKLAMKWLNKNFYLHGREKAYRFLMKRLIAEELMLQNGESPSDYKFYCFNGEPIFLSAVYSRYNNYSKNLYDIKGQLLPVTLNNVRNKLGHKLEIDTADFLGPVRKLAAPFRFVRVDMYHYQGRPKFGELTFTPYNGMGNFNPHSFDEMLSSHFQTKTSLSFFQDT